MHQIFEILNILALVIITVYASNQLLKSHAVQKKKKQDDEEIPRWENDTNSTSKNKEYDLDQWYFAIPQSAIQHLEVCFDHNQQKVTAMRRAIELSIEHYVHEMQDDAYCAQIIYDRTVLNPQPSTPFDIEEYQIYHEERIGQEGVFESLK